MLQTKSRGRLDLFSYLLFLAFIIKYNFLMLYIFNSPSLITLILRNILFAYFYIKFIEPLLLSKKIRQRLFILLVIFTAFFISNYWYNRYFGDFLSISDIFSGGGVATFSLFEVLFKHIIRSFDLIFIFDLFVIEVIGFNFTEDFKFSTSDNSSLYTISFKKNAAVGIFILLIILQIFAGAVYMEEISPARIYQEGTPYYAAVYGVIPLYILEAYSYLNKSQQKVEPDLDRIPYYKTQKQLSSIKHLPENTNLILIQVESLDAKIIDYKQGEKEIVPFLNDFKKRSIYFDNFYAQKVNGSFDADLSVLTSLYPVNRSYVFRDVDMSRFDSLPKLLKAEGYQTLAFHNNDRNYFNRAEAYPDLGFDHFYSEQDFSEEFFKQPEDRNLGVNDYDFLADSFEILKKAAERDKPYFAYFITLTSHTPFNYYPEEGAEEFEGIDSELVRNYFRSINFTDRALDNFINRLENAGMLENTLLVIYSDHESEIKTREYNSGREFTLWKNVKTPYHIPLMIYHPQLEARINSHEGTTTDIAPTILDLFAFESLPEQFVGDSMFLDQTEPLLFLHETPEIYYQKQIFIKELDKVEKVGHIKDQEKNVEISDRKLEELEEIINYMRRIFMINQGKIFEEVE